MGDIKLKTDISAEQATPFIEKIAKWDGLRTYMIKDFNLALAKFRMLLLICEQNKLQYWVNLDLKRANYIYEESLDFRTGCKMYDMTLYKN